MPPGWIGAWDCMLKKNWNYYRPTQECSKNSHLYLNYLQTTLQVYSFLYRNSSLNTLKIRYVVVGLLFGEYWQRFQYTELSSKLLWYVTCALHLPITRNYLPDSMHLHHWKCCFIEFSYYINKQKYDRNNVGIWVW